MKSIKIIQRLLAEMPTTAGVYQMLNKDGKILYIGKAKNLKKRITSYTHPTKLSARISHMVSQIADIEIITTDTEAQALILEQNLIKKFSPKYNILLKDDKSFPYLMFTKHPFPRLIKHRFTKGEKKGNMVFGPFVSGDALNNTIDVLHKAFLLRSCTDNTFKNRTRPCLEYQIKRCSAPCVYKIRQQEYAVLVQEAIALLKGKGQVYQTLTDEMEAYSKAGEYEKAITLRDRIQALERIQQERSSVNIVDADVIGIQRDDTRCCVFVSFYRGGQNFGGQAFFPKNTEEFSDEEILRNFISQFYRNNIPAKLLLVNSLPLDAPCLEEILRETHGQSIRIKQPFRGGKLRVVNEAGNNAKEALKRKQ